MIYLFGDSGIEVGISDSIVLVVPKRENGRVLNGGSFQATPTSLRE